MNKFNVIDVIDTSRSYKDLHLALDGELDGMNLLEEMKMLRNIIPENC
jgi:hypothetical protein